MKKNCLLLALFLLLFSCSSEDFTYQEENENVDLIDREPKLKTSGDEKYDVLGYGYDITEPFVEENSVKAYEIIDLV